MKQFPVIVCRRPGPEEAFFGKFKDPSSGKWRKMPGGTFPSSVNSRERAVAFAERWYEVEIAGRQAESKVPTTWAEVCDRYVVYTEKGYGGVATKHEATCRAKSLGKNAILNSRPVAEHDEALVLAWLGALAKEPVRTRNGDSHPRKFKTIRNIAKVVRNIYRLAQSLRAYPRRWELPTSGLLFGARMDEMRRPEEEVVVACPDGTVQKVVLNPTLPTWRRLHVHIGRLSGLRPGELHGLQFQDIRTEAVSSSSTSPSSSAFPEGRFRCGSAHSRPSIPSAGCPSIQNS